MCHHTLEGGALTWPGTLTRGTAGQREQRLEGSSSVCTAPSPQLCPRVRKVTPCGQGHSPWAQSPVRWVAQSRWEGLLCEQRPRGEVAAAAEPLRPPPLPSAPLHSSQALCLVQEETASGRMGSWGKGDSGLGLCGGGGTCFLPRLGLGQSCWEKRYVGEGDRARSRLGG